MCIDSRVFSLEIANVVSIVWYTFDLRAQREEACVCVGVTDEHVCLTYELRHALILEPLCLSEKFGAWNTTYHDT